MIWTFLGTAGAFLKRIPWQVWLIAAVLLTGWFYGNHRYSEGVADTKAEYARAALETAHEARKADAAGIEAANAGKASSAAEIDRAREAAKGGGDPWESALEAMRD